MDNHKSFFVYYRFYKQHSIRLALYFGARGAVFSLLALNIKYMQEFKFDKGESQLQC